MGIETIRKEFAMNQDNFIIIVADIGQLKAYRIQTHEGVDRRDDAQVSHVQKRGEIKKSTALRWPT